MHRISKLAAAALLVFASGCETQFEPGDARLRLTFQADLSKADGDVETELQSLKTTIERRMNNAGIVPAFIVDVSSDGQVDVLTPKVSQDQIEQITRLVTRPGTLQLAQLAHPRDHKKEIAAAAEDATLATPEATAAWVPVASTLELPIPHVSRKAGKGDAEQEEYLVFLGPDEQRVTGEYLKRASVEQGHNEAWQLEVEFSEAGGARMKKLSTAALPRPDGTRRSLAVILDGEIHSAPTVHDVVGARGVIAGDFDQSELRELANALNAGRLPLPVEFVESATLDEASDE